MKNTEGGRVFAPMGLEAVAMRIGNVCGHNLDANTECIEQKGLTAIRMADQNNSILTYAFVLNFFNATECYADFNSFGITIRPNDGDWAQESAAMALLEQLYCLVDRQEFKDGTWDLAAGSSIVRPAVEHSMPNLQWGYHVNSKMTSPETIATVNQFVHELMDFLNSVSHRLGNNASVWEYRNIDF